MNIKSSIRFNRFMTNVPMETQAFEKNSNWRWRVLNKHKKVKFENEVSRRNSIVILGMLNTFVKDYNYFKANVNSILSTTYKNDLIT